MKRHRRNAAEVGLESALNSQMALVMDVIHGQMMELQTYHNRSGDAACIVATNGSISCSKEIYDDPALWEASQQSVISQINKLQHQLEKLRVRFENFRIYRGFVQLLTFTLQDIRRHLDKKQPSKLLHNDVKLKPNFVEDDSTSKSFQNFTTTESYFENSTGESTKHTDVDITTSKQILSGHKHRHQHTTEGYRNPSSAARTKLHTVEDDEKHLNNNSIPDTCYCVPHSS